MTINRQRGEHPGLGFPEPEHQMAPAEAQAVVDRALARWHAATAEEAAARLARSHERFKDHVDPVTWWTDAANENSMEFFVWGHNHDFGFGHVRKGAMGPRAVEIGTECMALGLLPTDLSGKKVLDIGCWSGGDLLMLAGMGAEVTAIEEHPRAVESARWLAETVGCPTTIHNISLYQDQETWAGQYDLIYCAGVVYHVTDPLLFLRIAFAYLKPGGRLVLESKASQGEGAWCGYSGTLEKGWNWYAPTRDALGRWLADAGFALETIQVNTRAIGRLLAAAEKRESRPLRETGGFSRPGSWLEGAV